MTEKDIRELWQLAKAGDHVPDSDLTPLQKEIGFKSKFCENGHGGYWTLCTPRWLSLKSIMRSFLVTLGRIGAYGKMSENELEDLNKKFKNL